MTTLDLEEEHALTRAGLAVLVAVLVRLPREVSVEVPDFARPTMDVAQTHAAHCRRMMALLAVLLPGDWGVVPTAAGRFFEGDGDHAIGHRTIRFLLEGWPVVVEEDEEEA